VLALKMDLASLPKEKIVALLVCIQWRVDVDDFGAHDVVGGGDNERVAEVVAVVVAALVGAPAAKATAVVWVVRCLGC